MPTERDISPEQAAELVREQGAQLIDVREDTEWDAGRIGGARHIVLGQVAAQAQTIDRETPVVFYCRVGARSAMAADAFRRGGYEAFSLDGGLEAWAGEGRPLEPEGGSVAAH
jgi:rhodanese-related sulfurtransferase